MSCISFREFLIENSEDYRGMHGAPGKDDAPLYDVTMNGIYPDDIYSHQAVRLYSSGVSYDSEAISIIQGAKGRPKKRITVYRAVPNTDTNKKERQAYLNSYNYFVRFKFFKIGDDLPDKIEAKYSKELKGIDGYDERKQAIHKLMSDEIAKLMPAKGSRIGINKGDWVAICKKYAIEHGRDNLNNNYKIVSKTVSASELFTDGNSIHEWGYN